jgi:hypothetical protein
MNLFDIDATIQACVKLENSDGFVNVDTGEIIDTEALDALKMEKETKLRNIGCWILNLKAEEKMLSEQEKRFKERKDAAKRKRESLESYVGAFLNGTAWKCTECEYKFRKTESVAFTGDIYKVPEDYLRYKEPELDKTKVKKALKDGIEIPGCSIEVKNSLSVK